MVYLQCQKNSRLRSVKGNSLRWESCSQNFGPLEGTRESRTERPKGDGVTKVTDTFMWLQFFGTYVSVRVPPAPHLIPELMAYLATMVQVSQDFSGLTWIRYDAAFCQQAALMRNDRWSVINSTLYTMCFMDTASAIKRCELCFTSTHTEQECVQRGDPDPEMKDRLKAIETAMLALTLPCLH